jgi:hypothetical protein
MDHARSVYAPIRFYGEGAEAGESGPGPENIEGSSDEYNIAVDIRISPP